MKYELIQIKKIYHIEPSENGRFFIKVIAVNNKDYQVKFDTKHLKSNQNEFISNFIGQSMDAPILSGVFLNFTENQLKELIEYIKINFPRHIPDMSNIKSTIMFAIEWENTAIHAKNHDELKIILDKTKNKDSFYSLFSYDQYLKNFDRHLGNHLFNKDIDNQINNYYLIDGDRIFMALHPSKLEDIKDNFDCLRNPALEYEEDYHTFLYDFVTDETIYFILKYADNIEKISIERISYLIVLLENVYNLQKNDYDTIKEYLIYRKNKIFIEMMANSKCFPNVTQKRLGTNE